MGDGDIGHDSVAVVVVGEEVRALPPFVARDGALDGVVDSTAAKPERDEVGDCVVSFGDLVASEVPAMTPVGAETSVREGRSRPFTIFVGFFRVIRELHRHVAATATVHAGAGGKTKT